MELGLSSSAPVNRLLLGLKNNRHQAVDAHTDHFPEVLLLGPILVRLVGRFEEYDAHELALQVTRPRSRRARMN